MQVQEIIERFKKANPDLAHGYGFHEYDGILPDMSKEFVQNRISEIKTDLDTLSSMKPENETEEFELRLLNKTLKTELYKLEEEQEFLKSPLPWVGQKRSWKGTIGAIEMSYTQLEYAPVEERVKAITKLEKGIPEFLQLAEERLTELDEPLSQPKVQMGISYTKGHINYLKDNLISFVSQVEDDDLIDKWSQVNLNAIDALENFQTFLEKQYEKGTDEFALGKETFLYQLKMTEGVDIDVDTLISAGEKELERNLNMLQDIADRRTDRDVKALINNIQSIHPEANELLDYVREANDMAKRFLVKNDIVTIPTDKQCEVTETPEAMRDYAFAAMNTPGPFEPEEANQAYYWVTPVEAYWSDEQVEDHLRFMNKPFIHNVTVHEAWPGHYLQLLWSNQTESDIVKMFAVSYSMIEGWGLYSEEMIFEQGYEPLERDYYHVGQLFGALIRVVRFLAAVKMHCKGMSIEEAKQMFIEHAKMPPSSAQVEANRGSIDPMYLNYTLGKLLIKKLRDDYKAEKGDEYSLKSFHDALLSYGSPPIIILRDLILENNTGEIL